MAREGTFRELDQDFAVRGIVARSPELDALGYFALLRVNFVCCAADAMAMGFWWPMPMFGSLNRDNG